MGEAIVKYQIKKIIRRLLINSNNDVLLDDYIMSYMSGKCQVCFQFHTILKSKYIFRQKKNVCMTCYKLNHSHFVTSLAWSFHFDWEPPR